MEKEEKDIRFVARFYRENRLDTTQAWQKLGIGKQRNNSILLYRLITIAAVTFLIAGFSWWWIYDRQDWIVIASSAHAVKEVTLPDNSHITLAENSALQYDRLAYGKKNRNVTLNGKAYFSVTHQEQCPFRVQTELANIQVLGTQFQVTAIRLVQELSGIRMSYWNLIWDVLIIAIWDAICCLLLCDWIVHRSFRRAIVMLGFLPYHLAGV